MEGIKIKIIILFIVLLVSCSKQVDISLKGFSTADDVFVSGKALMSIDKGLHPLEDLSANQQTLLIGIHGSASRGYEWIYPLQTLDTANNLTLFFRWDDKNCPRPSYEELSVSINALLDSNQNFNKVIIIGHSYGALLASMFSAEWNKEITLDIHTIAGPLAGMSSIQSFCSYNPPSKVSNNVNFYQWRTIKELDAAFEDLDIDPQVIDLPGSKVKRLPETYNGRRLGHNWSISWVADEING